MNDVELQKAIDSVSSLLCKPGCDPSSFVGLTLNTHLSKLLAIQEDRAREKQADAAQPVSSGRAEQPSVPESALGDKRIEVVAALRALGWNAYRTTNGFMVEFEHSVDR